MYDGTIEQIYEAMAAEEQAPFEALNANFLAKAFVPSEEDLLALPFPYSFRLPPEWLPNERARGEGSNFHFDWEISVVILMGYSSGDFGALTKESSFYVPVFYETWRKNRTVNGLIRGMEFGKGYMGDMKIHGQGLFGLRFPLLMSQILNVRSSSIP